jgi:hypothetical protein
MAQHDDKLAERLAKEMARYQALDEAEINQVIAGLIADPKGQKFLWWLLQIGKWGTNPFAVEPTIMAFQVGEMNVGSAILARLIEVNPLGFAQLQVNRKTDDDRRNAAAQQLARDGDLFSPGDDYT